MRSSVLFWYWQILWTVSIPQLVPLGLLYKPFYEFFVVGFSPYGGPDVASLRVWEDPTSATITAWVRDDPGDLPMACSCSFLLCISPRKGGVLPEGAPTWEALPPPCPGCFLYPCYLKWSNSQSEIVADFLKEHMVFHFKSDG